MKTNDGEVGLPHLKTLAFRVQKETELINEPIVKKLHLSHI